MINTLHMLKPADTIELLYDYHFPPYITLAHMFNAPAGWRIKPRLLTQHQLQYVVAGSAEYSLDGVTYVTKRGDLVYHAPDILHAVTPLDDGPYVCISIVFHFGTSTLPLDRLFGDSRFFGGLADHPISNKLAALTAMYHQPGLQNQMLCQGLLMQVLHDLHQWSVSSSQTKIQEKTLSKLVLIHNYIARHYDRIIRHKELEELSGLSRNYIIVKFRNTFGMTPFEYLTAVRIEKAKELALQTGMSVSEIALHVGYADVHTFGRMFKSKVGVSLSEFCASLVIHELPVRRKKVI